MHLIQRMKIWRELRRLEQRVRDEPSPSTYVDLGQVYINLDMCEKALQAAADGLALFPESAELEQLRQFARRSQLRARIQALRDKLNRSPSPKAYRELAGLHLELGDFAAVQATCEECIVRHPNDNGAWLVLAQARLANFYRDLAAREGLEAVRCLQQVLQIDRQNPQAHRLLAEVYYRVGLCNEAKQHLEVLRQSGLDGPELADLMREVAAQVPFQGGLEAAFQAVEQKGALANAPATRKATLPRSEEGISRIRDALAQLADSPGVRKATYIKGSRALVKGDIKDGRDSFLRVARVVAKASQRFARRLDIGNFSKGVLDAPFGHICICSYGEVVAAVQCDRGSAVDAVLAELQELVAGSLYMAGVTEA